MTSRLKSLVAIARMTYREFRANRPELIGAGIAFYVLFSLGPLLFIVVEIAGLIFGKAVAESQIIYEIQTLVGDQLADVIRLIIENAESPPTQTLTVIISVPMVLYGATMVFYQIKNALDYIWGAPDSGSKGMLRVAANYVSSFLMVLFAGGILLFLIVKSFVLAMLSQFISARFPFEAFFMQSLDVILTFVIITFLFAMVYKKLTEPEIAWSDEWIGASVTSLLFTIAQYLLSIYYSKVDIASAYGAIGSFTLLVIWVYYSSLVFLLGAVFTKVYARERGSFREKKARNKQ